MIEFITDNEEIELKSYDPDATLAELATELESFRLTCSLKTSECKGCGECCGDNIPVLGLDIPRLLEGLDMSFEQAIQSILVLPGNPDMAFRRKAIREMAAAASITPLEAALLFEYNNAEPIILAKQVKQSNQPGQSESDGEASAVCCFLHKNLCSRYTIRPYSCGLYLCNMGQRLSYLQEMVIRQGTWHAYYKLGWIDAEDISHNPFLKADSYDKLPIADFEFNFENALEQLFFYF
jgi:Fe-S-cluster containining protein